MAAAHVRIALPWLQAALAETSVNDSLPALHALRWLGGRGRLVSGEPRAWREWLLEPVGGADLLARWPAGPALALANDSTASPPGSWCVAQPVHFVAGLDHLRLAPLAQAALADGDASALGALVSSHFNSGELTVAAFVQGAWLLRFDRAIDCSTQPPDAAVGRNVHDFMPAGRDGARIRSLMNEIQMLLHEHPVNQRRERARLLPVNGWWLWGFGDAVTDVPRVGINRWRLFSDDRWLRTLGHALGSDAGDVIAVASDTPRGEMLIALSQPPAQRVEESLASVDAGLLSMLASSVRAGRLQSLALLAGNATLHVDGSARLRFWRRPVAVSQWLA
jgi:hypothetical protein